MNTTTAAWARDPSARHEFRYWDGSNWTEHVADNGAQSIDHNMPATAQQIPPPPGFATPAVHAAEPASVYRYRPKTNGLAIASIVLGILWIYWIGSILAVIFGHQALKQTKQSGGLESGRGMALAGVILGCIGLWFLALVVTVAVAHRLGGS